MTARTHRDLLNVKHNDNHHAFIKKRPMYTSVGIICKPDLRLFNTNMEILYNISINSRITFMASTTFNVFLKL